MAGSASPLREIRTRLGLSQAECATALGGAVETFRTWDAGRRAHAPEAIVSQARVPKAKRPPNDRVPLQVLADKLHVHVRTLRAAAHDGRLAATFGPPARPSSTNGKVASGSRLPCSGCEFTDCGANSRPRRASERIDSTGLTRCLARCVANPSMSQRHFAPSVTSAGSDRIRGGDPKALPLSMILGRSARKTQPAFRSTGAAAAECPCVSNPAPGAVPQHRTSPNRALQTTAIDSSWTSSAPNVLRFAMSWVLVFRSVRRAHFPMVHDRNEGHFR